MKRHADQLRKHPLPTNPAKCARCGKVEQFAELIGLSRKTNVRKALQLMSVKYDENDIFLAEMGAYLACKANWAISYAELFGGTSEQFANDVLLECGITPVKYNGGVLLLELPDYVPLLRAIKRENRQYDVATDWPDLECTTNIEDVLNEYE